MYCLGGWTLAQAMYQAWKAHANLPQVKFAIRNEVNGILVLNPASPNLQYWIDLGNELNGV